MSGRTSWWAKDAAWHRRELQVELGDEFGPAGPFVLDVLSCWAQEQRTSGDVLGGFRTLAREAFVDLDTARRVVEHAARIGALDDLVVDDDGRRFTCRVSGFRSDQDRGRAAWRKAAQRAREDDEHEHEEPDEGLESAVTERDKSRSVTGSTPPDQTRPNQRTTDSEVERDSTASDVDRVFDAWVAATDRDPARTKLTADRRRRIAKALASHGLDDCLLAVQHIGADAWARGENDRGRRFDDIEHALGNAERIERWRDRAPAAGRPTTLSGVARGDAALARLMGERTAA